MNRYTRTRTLLAVFICMLATASYGQVRQQQAPIRQDVNSVTKDILPEGVERILWMEPAHEVGYDGSVRNFLRFADATFDFGTGLPQVLRNMPVGSGHTLRASLDRMRFAPITRAEQDALGNAVIPGEISISVRNYTERKRDFASVAFTPIRKNPSTGQMEKLVEFRLNTFEVPLTSPKAAAANNFSNASQLANGDWFKVAVTQDGIYRITYEQLRDMGMNVDGTDPRRLTVFGNGGGMLPQENNGFRHDDLAQNPIVVVGEEDGSFDSG
ncbi:MAG: hypothetical protein K9J06_15675, partial [Flavobacteriales bacterium]|nr:hypothetical protein [Flavobacteriales bacterium]